jgi:hypothetical protein
MHYEIRIKGALSERILLAFPDWDSEILGGETTLVGVGPDQSALHAVLDKVEELGLTLLDVHRHN